MPSSRMIAARRALCLALAAAVASCKDAPTAPLPATSSGQFDLFWTTFDEHYSYFDYKGVDWPRQRIAFRERAARIGSQDSLIALLGEMVAPLRDVHVRFNTPSGGTVPTWQPPTVENWDPSISAGVLYGASYKKSGANLGYGWLHGVGYIQISQWNDSTLTIAELDAALAHFKNEPRLIIDVRMNGGGSDSLAYNFAARFNTANRVVGYYKYRDGAGHSDFGAEVPRILGVRGPFQFTGRVLVLAGRYSYSANESFVAAMRELPDVQILGDTTGGGSGRPLTYDLGGGYKFSVPRWIEYTAKHEIIEWHGIPPNIFVRWNRNLVRAGRDPVLETALSLLGASP